MSTIEQRLLDDIQAVTEAVTVSEHDLVTARAALDSRLRSHRQRRWIQTAAVAACVILLAGVGFAVLDTLEDSGVVLPAEPAPDDGDPWEDFLVGEPPTPELVQGIWRVDNGTILLQFHADGTVQWSGDGAVISDPVVEGSYTIDGDEIQVTEKGGAPCHGRTVEMRATLPSPGSMHVVVPDQLFGTCMPVSSQMVLERVLPTSKKLSALRMAKAPGWEPLSDEERLVGDWLAEGGGYLLEMSPYDYYIADESAAVVDFGRWSLRQGDLVLQSMVDSSDYLCSRRDRLVLSGVEQVDLGTTGIRGTVTENTCDAGWTPEAWILLPHAGSSK